MLGGQVHQCDVPRHGSHLSRGIVAFGGGLWAGFGAAGLVVAGGVEGELAEEFASGGVDDADVKVGDEQDDGGAVVAFADADVV